MVLCLVLRAAVGSSEVPKGALLVRREQAEAVPREKVHPVGGHGLWPPVRHRSSDGARELQVGVGSGE